jgi:hypothetical protein
MTANIRQPGRARGSVSNALSMPQGGPAHPKLTIPSGFNRPSIPSEKNRSKSGSDTSKKNKIYPITDYYQILTALIWFACLYETASAHPSTYTKHIMILQLIPTTSKITIIPQNAQV